MALTSLPEEIIETFAELIVPCRHFQHPARVGKVPIGYCHRRRSEIPFQGNRCSPKCRMFECGLFDPLTQKLAEPEKPDDPLTFYRSEILKIRLGEKSNYFTWRTWMIFSGIVCYWNSSGMKGYGKLAKEMPLSEQILCLPASRVSWAKFELPKPTKGQSIFEYLRALLPKGGDRSVAKNRRLKVVRALDHFLSKSKFKGQIQGLSVISRYIMLRNKDYIPGD